MKRNIVLYIFCLLTFLACSAIKNKKKESRIQFAIGYVENIRHLSDKAYQGFQEYLPKRYTENPIFMKSTDVDFSIKQVSWHIGFGGTVFALKEIGEGIEFYPMMWESGCDSSLQWISTKKISNDLSKIKKILIYHTGYPSPLALTQLYKLDLNQIEIFETEKEQAAIDALKKNKIDLIISENYYIFSKSNSREDPILKIQDVPTHVVNFPAIRIPCRTLFYSPKLSEADKKEIIQKLGNLPWQSQKYKLGALTPIAPEEYQQIFNSFDWQLDNKIRAKLKNLNTENR